MYLTLIDPLCFPLQSKQAIERDRASSSMRPASAAFLSVLLLSLLASSHAAEYLIESSTAIPSTIFNNALRDPTTGYLYFATSINKIYQLKPLNATTAPRVLKSFTISISNLRAGAIAPTSRHLYYVSILMLLEYDVETDLACSNSSRMEMYELGRRGKKSTVGGEGGGGGGGGGGGALAMTLIFNIAHLGRRNELG